MKQIQSHSNSLLPFFAITLALCIFTLAFLPATANAFPRPIRTMEIVMPGDSDPDVPEQITESDHHGSAASEDLLINLYITPILIIINYII